MNATVVNVPVALLAESLVTVVALVGSDAAVRVNVVLEVVPPVEDLVADYADSRVPAGVERLTSLSACRDHTLGVRNAIDDAFLLPIWSVLLVLL